MKASLWKTIKRGETQWVVAYRVDGKLVRKFFGSREEAKDKRDELCGATDQINIQWATLSEDERSDWFMARNAVLKEGYSGLWDFVKRHLSLPAPGDPQKPVPSSKTHQKTVREAMILFYEAKSSVDRSQSYLANLRSTKNFMLDAFGAMPVDQVNTEMIEAWLRRWSLASRNTKLTHAKAFFNFTKKRQWSSSNPAEAVEKAKVLKHAPSVLSANDCERLMRSAPQEMLGYLVLCLFGGLRPSEAYRVTWDDVDWDGKLIHLPATKTKVSDWRNVPLSDTALAWLKIASAKRKKKTPKGSEVMAFPLREKYVVVSLSTIRRRRKELLANLGIEWRRNTLRHTAASILAAAGKTSAEASDILGNSPKVYRDRYRGRISRTQADAYDRIMPFSVVETSA